MRFLRRSLCVAAFAFSLCAWADDPIYLSISDSKFTYSQSMDILTYSYDSLPNTLSSLYPNDSFREAYSNCYFSDDDSLFVYVCPADEYFSYLDFGYEYIPYSSDPAYASPTPSGPPSGGGSGGGGEGGFDPVGSFGGLADMMSGLSTAALGMLGASAVVGLGYISSRKLRDSSKRV